jgi:hypothetical protein
MQVFIFGWDPRKHMTARNLYEVMTFYFTIYFYLFICNNILDCCSALFFVVGRIHLLLQFATWTLSLFTHLRPNLPFGTPTPANLLYFIPL